MTLRSVHGLTIADLFRIEVETEGKVLSDALLALERGGTANVQQLMRAAHSIKGAARVAGTGDAVNVAHALEDYFVNAAELDPGHVDVLLRAVDVLTRLANNSASPDEARAMLDELAHLTDAPAKAAPRTVTPAPLGSVAAVFRSELMTHCTAIRGELESTQPNAAVLRGAFDAIAGSARLLRIAPLAAFANAAATGAVPNVAEAVEALLELAACEDESFNEKLEQTLASLPNDDVTLSRADGEGPPSDARDPSPSSRLGMTGESRKQGRREVRITADKLDRLMAATGETTVAARWFDGFTRTVGRLKQQQDALLEMIEQLQERMPALDLDDLHRQAAECRAESAERFEECITFSRQLENVSGRLYREVIATRMRPFSVGVHPFPRLVRDVARQLGKQVELEIAGGSTEVDREILEKLEAPLSHLLRNAIDHGIEAPEDRQAAGKPAEGRIRVEAMHQHGMLHITVMDDGGGIDVERVRERVAERGLATPEIVARLNEAELFEFLFLPGFTTTDRVTEISGRGVGLDVVQSMVQEVGGVVRVAARPGDGTTFTLKMPITRSVVRALLVDIAGEPYAVPLTRIEHALLATRDQIHVAENREYVEFDGVNVGIVNSRQILGIEGAGDRAQGAVGRAQGAGASEPLRPAPCPPRPDTLSILILNNQRFRYGIAVDAFTGESDLVTRPLDSRLGKVPNISAVSVTLDGTPILLLDVDDVVTTVDELLNRGRLQRVLEGRTADEARIPVRRKRVLIVDDSVTVREVERRLLESNGYEVEVAVDGMHGWNAVRSSRFDLVISDVDMPRMTGIDLLVNIRSDARLARLPVMIVSYKDREEDRTRGLEAGANGYLTKGSFADDTMLRAVAELIGPGDA